MAGQWRHKTIRNTDIHVGGSILKSDGHGVLTGVVTDEAERVMIALPDFELVEDKASEKAESVEAATVKKDASKKSAPKKKPASKK